AGTDLWGNLYRLRDRKFLLEDKKRLCAWALGTALLGILLMVLHAELCPGGSSTHGNGRAPTEKHEKLFINFHQSKLL
uniref:Uncharacterized protein n=1 Tax=Sinocyclocheilus rhinocerous TaxID=307959 RepID=A0A673JD45_9TELE